MLNGIDVAGLSEARTAITADPAAGQASYGVVLNWLEGTKIEARSLDMVLGSSKIERNFRWIVDEPPQLLGKASGPTPQEYLISGVAACILVGFVVNATVKNIKIDKLSIKAEGSLDLAGFLNLRPDAQIKMAGLTYEIDVVSSAPEADLQEVAAKAFNFSPNAMTVANGIPIYGSLKVRDLLSVAVSDSSAR
jgi:uncharacterized OsmC-like protein